MGCNCNKRKQRVLRREEMISERAVRIASAGPQPSSEPAPTWDPTNGPRPTGGTESTTLSSG